MLVWGRRSADTRPILRDGTTVASVRPLEIRDHAAIEIDGAAWSYYTRRDELFGTRAGESKPTLRATRPTRRTWIVLVDGTEYRIEQFGLPRSRFTVARSGMDIGSSGTTGLRRRRPTLDVGSETPLEHQVFLLWVAFVMRGRPGVRTRRNSYTGGAGGAAPAAGAYGDMGVGGDGGI
ncbi:MAG: hypothetical protein ACRDO7_05595 [Nocardioidaceae bacterium]